METVKQDMYISFAFKFMVTGYTIKTNNNNTLNYDSTIPNLTNVHIRMW